MNQELLSRRRRGRLLLRWAFALGLAALHGVPVAAPPLDAQALLQDLSQFRTAFLDRDRALAGEARREAESRLQGLTARAGTLDRVELGLELARIAALADNGHSLVLLGPLLDQSNRVPIRLTVFEGQFHVVRARQAHAGLLGGRLLAIDDIPLERLRQTAHALVGGVAARRDRQAPPLLESPHMLHALGLVTHPASARYRVELATGAVVEQRLVAEEPAATRPRASTERLLLPEVTPAQDGWLTALGAADAPWSLRDALSRFRWRDDARLDALVVELRQTFDASGQRLQDFFAQVHEALAARPRSHLVLDLRLNGGGDFTKARDFVEDLPRRVPGRIVVLTSPWTFSAAISLAGYLKQAAPERVRIVGEAVGDRLVFFAEGKVVALANTGIRFLPATERHDYLEGCRAHHDCHGNVVRRPIAVASLAPDVAAPWTYDAWHAGRDPAMVAVERLLEPAGPAPGACNRPASGAAATSAPPGTPCR